MAGFVGSANVLHGHVVGDHLKVGDHLLPADAQHLADGAKAKAFVRPHDVRLVETNANGASVEATVERITSLGWLARLVLRLADGQVLTAEVPREELGEVEVGRHVRVDLRNAKAFDNAEAPGAGGDAETLEEADAPPAP